MESLAALVLAGLRAPRKGICTLRIHKIRKATGFLHPKILQCEKPYRLVFFLHNDHLPYGFKFYNVHYKFKTEAERDTHLRMVKAGACDRCGHVSKCTSI
jgi:hypothetical protein